MIQHYIENDSKRNLLGNVALLLVGLFILGLFLSGCSSMSKLPEKKNVKVSREKPDADDKCEDLGKVVGRTISTKGKPEEALEDITQEAANKGANYLYVSQYSAQGTSATGIAYHCP